MFSQCPNDICETATELTLCNSQPLVNGCTQDWQGGNIDLAGNVVYPSTAIGNDQWYNIQIEEPLTVTIDLLTNYSFPNSTNSSSFGLNEGVIFILWYGDDCNSLVPVLHSSSTIGSGVYCGADEYTPNPCPFPLSSWTCNNCLDDVIIGSPPYIATLLNRPSCCNGWTNQCNNEYLDQVLFYNTAQSAWNWQYNLGPIDGLCPFDPTEQNWGITMNLIPGTYWFQVYPFENTQAGYISEGEGTINICGVTFLDLEEETEIIEITEENVFNKPKRYMHPIYGLLVILPDGRSIDMMGRQITTYGVDFE